MDRYKFYKKYALQYGGSDEIPSSQLNIDIVAKDDEAKGGGAAGGGAAGGAVVAAPSESTELIPFTGEQLSLIMTNTPYPVQNIDTMVGKIYFLFDEILDKIIKKCVELEKIYKNKIFWRWTPAGSAEEDLANYPDTTAEFPGKSFSVGLFSGYVYDGYSSSARDPSTLGRIENGFWTNGTACTFMYLFSLRVLIKNHEEYQKRFNNAFNTLDELNDFGCLYGMIFDEYKPEWSCDGRVYFNIDTREETSKTLTSAYLGHGETFHPRIPKESILGPVRFVTVYKESNVLEDEIERTHIVV